MPCYSSGDYLNCLKVDDKIQLRSSLPTLPSTPAPASTIRSIVHVAKSRCAFVNFVDRAAAERAAEAWANGLEVDGVRVGVRWGRSRAKNGGGGNAAASGSSAEPVAQEVAAS